MATMLLAGATGTVGSYLLPLLQKEGHKVVSLVRSKDGQSPCNRVKGDVLAGDITLPNCGLADKDIEKWRGKIDKVVNSAACLKFLDSCAEEAKLVNVDGVRNLLDLAEKLRVPEFHQVSTAYVAGSAERFSEDDVPNINDGRNVYERTKAKAEELVRSWKQGSHSIYRLGIVVGDSRTGYTSVFNGYYVFMNSMWHLKKVLLSKEKDELEEYKAERIYFDECGSLRLPVSINFSADCTLNLTPIDWTCEMLAKLIKLNATNKVFHLVNPDPPRVRWINDISLQQCLGINGYCYESESGNSQASLLGKLQRVFDRLTAQYEPYVIHEPKFQAWNAEVVLGSDFVSPPEITESLIFKLLDYAKSVDFGREEQSTKAVKV